MEQGRKAKGLEHEQEREGAKVKVQVQDLEPASLVSANALLAEKKLHIRQEHHVTKLNVPNVVERWRRI
jgi:hypothetical protein